MIVLFPLMDPDFCIALFCCGHGGMRTADQTLSAEMAGELCIAHQYAGSNGVCNGDYTADRRLRSKQKKERMFG